MARSSVAELVTRFEALREDAFAFPRGYRSLRWSYRRVAATARRFAAELHSRGITRGDRVLLWGENCAEWVAAFYGCVLYGAVVVPLDRASTRDFASRVARDVGAKLAVCSREVQANVAGIPVMVLEELETAVASRAPFATDIKLTREDPLEIIFTSGTTGQPKGVVITHGNVLANLEPLETEIDKYRTYERVFHPLRFLNLVPLSHVFGQFLALFVPQALGATVHFHASLNPAEVIHLIHRDRIHVCIAVPRMLESLKSHIEREYRSAGKFDRLARRLESSANLHFVRRWWNLRDLHKMFGWQFWAFISGGSALDETTETFWTRAAFAVIQGYGMTETTSLVTVNHPFRRGQRSIGKTLAGREVKLAEDGEILVRGENIARRYWQDGQFRESSNDGGWLRTGDLGALDDQGNLYFKGRKKNVIVTPAGMNVHPEDLEAVLRKQRGVRDAVVVGLPVGGNAEPCAVLLFEAEASPEEVIASANRELAEHQRLRHWRVWPGEDFPRTATMKPRLAELEKFARDGASSPPPLDDLLRRVTTGSGSRDVLQLSSLEKVELMSAIESRYQVDLSETNFAEAESLTDVQKLIAESGSERRYEYPEWPQRWPWTWIRTLAYVTLAWPAQLLLAKPRVLGREKLCEVKEPVLVVCNHVTQADIGFILWALPWRLRRRLAPAMRAEMLWEMREPHGVSFLRARILQLQYWLLTALFAVFPLPQRSGFLKSFAFAGESIDRGYSVLVFPEGKRTQTGELAPFQNGVGVLANRLRVPIVPLKIEGLFEAARAGKLLVAPNRIVVKVGDPVRYGENVDAASIAHDLERRVREL